MYDSGLKMIAIDHTFELPRDNIDFDRFLLGECDRTGTETLRFWESKTDFLVLGASNVAELECDGANSTRDGIPIVKRPSGGGTVVQGPGCLNYALILSTTDQEHLQSPSSANAWVMNKIAAVVRTLTHEPVEVAGHTDLVIGDRKFSGNAQRRGRRSVLIHGTMLIDMDLEKVVRYLVHPTKEPAYREGRSHLAFVRTIVMSRRAFKDEMMASWGAASGDSWGLVAEFLRLY